MTFVLEAVSTLAGSSLLLHFGQPNTKPSRILVDCGAKGTYGARLRPRLEQLRGDDRSQLPIHLVVACQTDDAHMVELDQMLQDIEEGRAPHFPAALWLNPGHRSETVLQKARQLGIALNPPFAPDRLRASTEPVAQGAGLSFEVLAPFNEEPGQDDTAPILLARKGDQSILIAGDASGLRITGAMIQAGYLDLAEAKSLEDPFHVNLMAITQQDRSSLTPEFFRKVTADSYLFAAVLDDANKDTAVLRAIGDARGEDEFNLYFATTARSKGASENKCEVLDWVASEMPGGCVAHFREDVPERYSTLVELPA